MTQLRRVVADLGLVTLGVNFVAALVCLGIGISLARRKPQGPARRASIAFSVWWIALAVDMLLNNAPKTLVLAGFAPPPLIVAVTYAVVAAMSLMFWGLVYYLVYLFTGREGAFWPVTIFYAITFVLATTFIASLHPVGATPSGGIAYANQPSAVAALLWGASILLPPILGSLAYGALVFRVKDAFRRYRIALVSTSMFLWFTTALVANAPGASSDLRAGGLAVGLLALLGLALAYFPPAALRRRLDIEPNAMLHVVHEGVPDASFLPQPDRAARRDALLRRARELI